MAVLTEFLPNVKKIEFEGPDSHNPLAFKWYNADEEVAGKSMEEHLRFSMAYWHSFRGMGGDPFGPGTIKRPWEDKADSVENAKNRARVAFEVMSKLGVPFYCFHDRDMAPEGATLAESHKNLDEVVKVVKDMQDETGIGLLWGTANLFSNPRYMCGASTNPDAHVFAYAAAQVKKMMEVTLELGGSNYVFWGGREGYQTLLNTDIKRELDHMANFLRMAADHKTKIGFTGTLLVEPKPKEPMKHQYDFDAATVMGFLTHYGLNQDFKLNLECNHATLAGHDFQHDLELASRYGMLGSVDANSGDTMLGWDTDQFPMDIRVAALAMLIVLNQGGLGNGGFNFDAKVRRESVDVEDLLAAHVGGMDTLARGLKIAARIIEDGTFGDFVNNRYASYDSGMGAKIEAGTTNFEEISTWVLKQPEPTLRSGQQEKLESLLNTYL